MVLIFLPLIVVFGAMMLLFCAFFVLAWVLGVPVTLKFGETEERYHWFTRLMECRDKLTS